MDFLYLDPTFQALICTRCQYALVPGTIAAHLRSAHKEEVTAAEVRSCVRFWQARPIQPAKAIQQLELPIDTPPIPNLALYHDGILCRLCTKRPFICSGKTTSCMQKHLKTVHAWTGGYKRGRPPKASLAQKIGYAAVTTTAVSY